MKKLKSAANNDNLNKKVACSNELVCESKLGGLACRMAAICLFNWGIYLMRRGSWTFTPSFWRWLFPILQGPQWCPQRCPFFSPSFFFLKNDSIYPTCTQQRVSWLKLLSPKSCNVLKKNNLIFQELFLITTKIDSKDKKNMFSHYLGVKITWWCSFIFKNQT